MVPLEHRTLEVIFSTATPPSWAVAVDRWYQLDAPAFALAEAWSQWNAASPLPTPRFIVGASATASNASDRAFAESPRAHRFVHTLPSVRYAALCQVMRWAGPLLCVQRDPTTLAAGLATAMDFHAHDGETWVLGARPTVAGAQVDFLRLGVDAAGTLAIVRSEVPTVPVATDADLAKALVAGASTTLEGGWCLVPR